ncbi:MAG: hypothetical protein NC311_09700 [Muribaculaceae bacterium]|nr:hypothetical protein [Muribaculaceae bacterium]
MKQKIKEALQQGYKQLGLNEEAFERVAAFGETFIKEESQIATFVQGAEAILKAEQSAADKVRTELNAKIKGLEGEKSALEAKLNGNQPNPPEPPKLEQPQDMAKIIADAVAAAIKPISDELAGFKAEQGAKAALANAEATFKSNDYVKKYGDEATDAWERATEMYEATGKSWTAEELQTKAMGYFNKAVAKKGVDTAKPFESDGGGGNPDEANKAFADEIRKALGKDKE